MAPTSRFTLAFDIKTSGIEQVEGSMKKVRDSLSKIKLPSASKSNFTKMFDDLDAKIVSFKAKAAKELTSMSDIRGLNTSAKQVIDAFNKINVSIKGLEGADASVLMKMLPDEAITKLNKVNQAWDEYNKKISETAKKEKDLQDKLRAAAKKQETKAQDKQKLESKKQVEDVEYDMLKALTNSTKRTYIKLKKESGSFTQEQIDSYEKLAQAIDAVEAKKAETGRESLDNRFKVQKDYVQALQDAQKTSGLNADDTIKAAQDWKILVENVNKAEEAAKKAKQALDGAVSEADIKKASTEYDEATNSVKELENQLNQVKQANSTAFDELKNKLAEISGVDFSFLEDGEDGVRRLIQEMGKMTDDEILKIRDAFKEIGDAAQPASDGAEQLADSLKRTNEEGQNLDKLSAETEQLKNRMLDFFGINNVIELFKRAISSAVDTVKELDAAMTEIAVVSDFTVGDMWSSLPQFTEQANQLGVSIADSYKATTLYVQQGMNLNQAMSVGTETLKMARIAGMDAADATDAMTAALRGFNMELNETSAQRINDVYSELAAITAADTEEISTAMTKTASIASSANMEFETTAAFLSQIIETTRESAETAGTALKTVIARFTELKKDPSMMQEVDGEVIDANKIETALRSIGVALTDTSGQFRDLDDVFLDISKKWDGLTTNQQRYIATIAAGSRQQSRFIAMMSDYDRTMELVNAAQNSAGASNKQFEKTIESLESKLARLQNSWDEFSMGLANNDVIKGAVEALIQLLEVVNNLTGMFGDSAGGGMKTVGFIAGLTALRPVVSALFDTLKNGDTVWNNLQANFQRTGQEAQYLGKHMAETGQKVDAANKSVSLFNGKITTTQGAFQNYSAAIISGVALLAGFVAKVNEAAGGNERLTSVLKDVSSATTVFAEALMLLKVIGVTLSPTTIVIMAIVTALGVLAKTLVDIEHDNSMTGMFEKAEKAATGFADATKAAEDAVKNLGNAANSLNELENKISHLTKGTLEYRQAVLEANEQVLQMAQDYPELGTPQFENGRYFFDEGTVEKAQELYIERQEKLQQQSFLASGYASYREAQLKQETAENLPNIYQGYITPEREKLIKQQQQSYRLEADRAQLQAEAKAQSYIQQVAEKSGFDNAEIISAMLGKDFAETGYDQIEQVIDQYKNTSQAALEKMYADMSGMDISSVKEMFVDNADALREAIAIETITTGNLVDENGQAIENWSQLVETGAGQVKIAMEKLGDDAGAILSAGLGKSFDDKALLKKINKSNLFTADFARSFNEIGQDSSEAAETIKNHFADMLASLSGVSDQLGIDMKGMWGRLQVYADEGIANFYQSLIPLTDIINESGGNGAEVFDYFVELQDEGKIGTEELANAINSINWDNPIRGAIEYNKIVAKAKAAGSEKDPSKGESLFGLDKQVKYFFEEGGWGDIQEEVQNLIDTTEGISGSTVEELANSCSDLQLILENTSMTAEGFAEILNSIGNGASLDGLTKEVTDILSGLGKATEMRKEWSEQDWTAGTFDSSAPIGYMEKASKMVEEQVSKGAYANQQVLDLVSRYDPQGYADILEGQVEQTQYQAEVSMRNFIDGALAEMKQLSTLSGAYDTLASKTAGTGFTQEIGDKTYKIQSDAEGNIRFGAIDESGNIGSVSGMTREDFALFTKEFGKATEMSPEAVKAMFTAYAETSTTFSTEWNRWEAQDAADKYITGNRKAITEDELALIESSTTGPIFEQFKELITEAGISIYSGDASDLRNVIASKGETDREGLADERRNVLADNYVEALERAQSINADSAEALKQPIYDYEKLNQAALSYGTNIDTYVAAIADGDTAVISMTDSTGQAYQVTVDLANAQKSVTEQINEQRAAQEQLVEQAKQQEAMDYLADSFAKAMLGLEAIDINIQGKGIEETQDSLVGLKDTATEVDNLEVTVTAKTEPDPLSSVVDDIPETKTTTAEFVPDSTQLDTKEEEIKTTSLEETVNFNPVTTAVDAARNRLSQPIYTTNYINTVRRGVAKGGEVKSYASGANKIEPGKALTGEEAPEIVWNKEKGYAYITGENGPQFTDLQPGDRVFSGQETKKILAQKETSPLFGSYSIGFRPTAPSGGGGGSGGGTSRAPGSSKISSKKEDIWENPYDWLYNLTEQINESIRDRNLLEQKYKNLLDSSVASAARLYENLKLQTKTLEQQRQLQRTMVEKRAQEIKELMEENAEMYKYGYFDFQSNQIKIDWDLIDTVKNTDEGEKIEKYIGKLEDIQKEMEDAAEELLDIESELINLDKQVQERYITLEDRVVGALVKLREDEIEQLSDLNTSLSDANERLLNSLQASLDFQRQERSNRQTEESIADKQARLAYLRQDTSGANQSEILALEKEISQMSEDYTDTLVDQKINELEKQNADAAEQRQRQIDIQEALLTAAQENGAFNSKAYELIENGVDSTGKLITNSDLVSVLAGAEGWKAMSDSQREVWVNDLISLTAEAVTWLAKVSQLENIGETRGTIEFTYADAAGNKQTLTGQIMENGAVKVGQDYYHDVFKKSDGTYWTYSGPSEYQQGISTNERDTEKLIDDIASALAQKLARDYTGSYGDAFAYGTARASGSFGSSLHPTLVGELGEEMVVDPMNGRWYTVGANGAEFADLPRNAIVFNHQQTASLLGHGSTPSRGTAMASGNASDRLIQTVLGAVGAPIGTVVRNGLDSIMRQMMNLKSGDNYFDITVQVDSLSNDYDVEQMINVIKREIVNDANYRNVNVINRSR